MISQSISSFSEFDLSINDPRLKRLLTVMTSYGYRQDALIQVLHEIQEFFGYLPLPILKLVSKELHLPPSQVFGVATFYHFFTLKPKGEHNCLVCLGTACYVKGGLLVLDQIEKSFNLLPGETTANKRLGLQVARCIGSCGLAPAVSLDGQVFPHVKPSEITSQIKSKIEVTS